MAELYVLEFPNGKLYVGITSTSTSERLGRHVYSAFKQKSRYAVSVAIRKYGVPSVALIFKANDFEHAKALEIEMIKHWRTRTPDGYNLTDGGDGVLGVQFSVEARAKMSAAKAGKRHTEEHRAKVSATQRGGKRGPCSESTRRKISNALKGRSLSKEHREKLSAARKRA